MKRKNWISKLITFTLLILIVISIHNVSACYSELSEGERGYHLARRDITNFMDASDYLTEQARLYVETENTIYLQNYFTELNETKRRELAIQQLIDGADENKPEIQYLQKAYELSNSLAEIEYHAMRLVSNANLIPKTELPVQLQDYTLTDEEIRYEHPTALKHARYLLFDNTYLTQKEDIVKKTKACCQLILTSSEELEIQNNASMNHAILVLFFSVFFLAVIECASLWIKILFHHEDINDKSKAKKKDAKNEKKNRGFTRFEYIIGVTVITLVLCAMAPIFMKYLKKTQATAAQKNAITYKKAIELILVDALMNDQISEEDSRNFCYQAFSSKIAPPQDFPDMRYAYGISQQVDLGKTQYELIALIQDASVTQLIYKDLKHETIYVWFSSIPQGSVLAQPDYQTQTDTWLTFDSPANEEWEPMYTGYQASEIAWNGYSDPSKYQR